MKRLFTVMILAAMLVAGGFAEGRWTLFFYAANGSKGYLDYPTIQWLTQDNATVWVKVDEPAGDYWINHMQLYRPTRQMKILNWHHYNTNGEIINSGDTAGGWFEAVPDGLGDELFKVVFPRSRGSY